MPVVNKPTQCPFLRKDVEGYNYNYAYVFSDKIEDWYGRGGRRLEKQRAKWGKKNNK